MRTNNIRETYRYEVWLPASIVQWLDSRYPDDEPEIAIAKALKALQGRDRRASERSVQVLARPEYPPVEAPKSIEPTPTPITISVPEPEPKPEPIAPTPTPTLKLSPLQATMLQKSRTGDPVSWIHQFCQLSRSPLPQFDFEPIANGFSCRVRMLDREGTGAASTKKEAKRIASQTLLDRLQS